LLFQILASAEEKLQARERDKYQQFIRDVDKVTCLLLKLSDMLARAENAVRCLPEACCAKEKVG
jgi:Apx/Shroom domain ASD2